MQIDIPYPLLSDIFEGRCLPFVGAGFSKNADLPPGLVMPDWNQLAAALVRHLPSVGDETPQEVTQRYERHFGRVQLIEAIRRALHTDSARPGRAHRAFAKLGEKFDIVYRTLIAPSVEDSGLSVMRADEMTTPGFIIEQIRSAIQQSRLCIADVTGANPNVLYELGFAQASGKPVVMIAESAESAPFDIAAQRIFVYGASPSDSRSGLEAAIRTVLSEERLAESRALLRSKQYRGAIAAAAVVLENELRGLLVGGPVRGIKRMGLGQMLREAARRRLVSPPMHSKLRQVVEIRNQAVHHLAEPDRAAAATVIEVAGEFVKTARKAG